MEYNLASLAPFGTGSPAEEAQKPSGLGMLLGAGYGYLGDLAKRSIGNSQMAVQGGAYNAAPAMETALSLIGAGLPMAERGAIGVAGGRLKQLPSSASLATPPAPTVADMLRSAKVDSVPLSQTRGTQPKMQWEKFDSGEHPEPMLKGYEDRPIAVKREDGEYLIFDGHHRAAKAINDGSSNMEMYVINAKDYAPEFAGRKPSPSKISDDDLLKMLRE